MTNPAMEKAKAALHAQLSKDGTIEDMVRAVLLAVREPTDDLLDLWSDTTQGLPMSILEEAWPVLIDYLVSTGEPS